MRRLFTFASTLSLLLSLATAAAWVRSQFVTEGWEFQPRPSGMNHQGTGWYGHRVLESGDGRLVYADYRYLVRGDEPHPDDQWLVGRPELRYLPTFRHRFTHHHSSCRPPQATASRARR